MPEKRQRAPRLRPVFVRPRKRRSEFDIYREIGEEMGVPFPLVDGEHWCVEDLEPWVLKIGWAFISHHSANQDERRGRPRDRNAVIHDPGEIARKSREKRARRRQRENQEKAAYLAWFKERYKDS
jgi:hypothetical protein